MTLPVDPASAAARSYRLALDRPGTLRDPTRAPIDVVIDNLSETGALLRGASTLPVGTLVSLGVPGAGLRLARVVRLQTAAMAIEFMVPFEPAAVARARNAETLVSIAFPQMNPGAMAMPVPVADPRIASVPGGGADRRSVDPRLLGIVGQAPTDATGDASGLLWLVVAGIVAVALIVLLFV